MAKREIPPVTLEEATREATELWAEYRAARERDAPAPEFETLQARSRAARGRAKKRSDDPGFHTLAQQLGDLGEVIKRFKPRVMVTPADPDALRSEVDAIRRALALPTTPTSKRAIEARARSVQARIEESRAQAPDADSDHDLYVGIEEDLWDLGFAPSE